MFKSYISRIAAKWGLIIYCICCDGYLIDFVFHYIPGKDRRKKMGYVGDKMSTYHISYIELSRYIGQGLYIYIYIIYIIYILFIYIIFFINEYNIFLSFIY